MTTNDLRILSYLVGPAAGYWGVWVFRRLGKQTATEEGCRRGALLVGLVGAVPLFMGATRSRQPWLAESLAAVGLVVYSLVVAKFCESMRAYARDGRRGEAPSMPGLAVRAIAFPAIALALGAGAAAGVQKLGVGAQLSYALFPILQLAAVTRLASLARQAGRGYWMLVPGIVLLGVTLVIAIVGAPVG